MPANPLTALDGIVDGEPVRCEIGGDFFDRAAVTPVLCSCADRRDNSAIRAMADDTDVASNEPRADRSLQSKVDTYVSVPMNPSPGVPKFWKGTGVEVPSLLYLDILGDKSERIAVASIRIVDKKEVAGRDLGSRPRIDDEILSSDRNRSGQGTQSAGTDGLLLHDASA